MRETLEKYKVLGVPVVVLMDSAGREAQRITQLIPADEMRAALEDVR